MHWNGANWEYIDTNCFPCCLCRPQAEMKALTTLGVRQSLVEEALTRSEGALAS